MPRLVTRSTLRTRIRNRVDMSNQYVSDADLNDLIDTYVTSLYDKLIAARGQEYYLRTNVFPTVAGQTLYQLPSDFYELVDVYITQNSWRYMLKPFQRQNTDLYLNQGTSWGGYDYVYRLRGLWVAAAAPVAQIEILPPPSGVFDITIDYIPVCTISTQNDPEYDGINGWEEWVVLNCCIMMMQKEESDPSVLMAQRGIIEDRIEKLANSRDAGVPEKLIDSRRDLFDDWYNFRRGRWAP